MTKYENLAKSLKNDIQSGLYKESERIPSLREIQDLKDCSLTTAREAYRILEEEGLIEAKPQSGYFVRRNIEEKISGLQNRIFETVSADDRIQMIMRDVMNPKLLPFGAAIPEDKFLPLSQLIGGFKTALLYKDMHKYGDLEGFAALREKIARMSGRNGFQLSMENILITNGCTESLSISLQSCTNPGDTILLPSPTYVGIFQIVETLKLKLIEIPYRKEVGLDISETKRLCTRYRPKAIIITANFNNPNGVLLSDNTKQELANILQSEKIALIEDDMYGDLYWGKTRPRPLISYMSFSKAGPPAFLCSSFSKTIAPGIRIGWIGSRNSLKTVSKIARAFKISHNLPTQIAVFEYLKKHSYDRHLNSLRKTFASNFQIWKKILQEASNGSLEIDNPEGGFVLWGKAKSDTQKLLIETQKKGIIFAPGILFGVSDQWKIFFRLNLALVWRKEVERALEDLGKISMRKKN
ncbi:PLP-dependent aminotransferase family protein [Leptospira ilyithenensis]|uniref:PLP-dependent aminotransferase family protein n=1 Tax=Leptospira ilyithenensis TaxID=2484901 RepID=A0A4R9LRQ2_9LEPT|nr:PLP-dependent aminotransferase family protein [Leptospira ilyithenensis]TGN13434.1 PLP-dependent aminotransferase family protein [Leptospira ilyithenensis]